MSVVVAKNAREVKQLAAGVSKCCQVTQVAAQSPVLVVRQPVESRVVYGVPSFPSQPLVVQQPVFQQPVVYHTPPPVFQQTFRQSSVFYGAPVSSGGSSCVGGRCYRR